MNINTDPMEEVLDRQAREGRRDRYDGPVYSPAQQRAILSFMEAVGELATSEPLQKAELEYERDYELAKALAERSGYRATPPPGKSREEIEQTDHYLFEIMNMLHTRQGVMGKASGRLTVPVLRQLSNSPVPFAIIQMRQRQLSELCYRPRTRNETGFKVVLRNPDLGMKDAHQKWAREIEEFLLAGHWLLPRKEDATLYNSEMDEAQPLADNCKKFLKDSMTQDFAGFYLEPGENAARYPVVWLGTTNTERIRKVQPRLYRKEFVAEKEIVKYVEVTTEENVVREYTSQYMDLAIRNPITYDPYGIPELEILYHLVAYLTLGIRMNGNVFTESNIPPGLLSLVGRVSDRRLLQDFRTRWEAKTRGVDQAHRALFMAFDEGPGAVWTRFRDSNRDMEFNQLCEFLITLICAVMQTQPEEVGFRSWRPTGGNTIGSEASPEARLTQGEDKGFNPLVRDWFNLLDRVVRRVDPDYTVIPSGMEEDWQSGVLEEYRKRMEMGMATPNLVLRALDEEELEEEWADLPVLNPLAMQAVMASRQPGPEEENPEGPETGAKEENQEQGEEGAENLAPVPPEKRTPVQKALAPPRIIEVHFGR